MILTNVIDLQNNIIQLSSGMFRRFLRDMSAPSFSQFGSWVFRTHASPGRTGRRHDASLGRNVGRQGRRGNGGRLCLLVQSPSHGNRPEQPYADRVQWGEGGRGLVPGEGGGG